MMNLQSGNENGRAGVRIRENSNDTKSAPYELDIARMVVGRRGGPGRPRVYASGVLSVNSYHMSYIRHMS
ncbi:hypothetical protein MASSI9I_90543 [Massilia sp. 9I]|nr:hypothetical protein MASSI9I_90543 [Massilia sp. 9I]